MGSVLAAFIISLIICGIIPYVLGLFWFSDARNRWFCSFFILGIEVFIWVLLNAITMVCSLEYFPLLYTLRMVMVCIVPFGIVWFILDFTASKLIGKRWIRALLIALPLLDILCMTTNPLHHLYFLNYNYPVPVRAPIFWVHTAIDFLFIIIAFVILIRFIIKDARSHPILIIASVAMMIPYAMNLSYSLGMHTFPHDLTPIGFFFALILFMYAAYRLQLLNIKTALFSCTMDSLSDVIVLFNENLIIMDANKRAFDIFGDFSILVGRTHFDDFCRYLNDRTVDVEPLDLIGSLKTSTEAEGEFSFDFANGHIRTYTLTWRSVLQGKRLTGYILMLNDVSSYKDMICEIHAQNERLASLKEVAEAASQAKGRFLSRMSHEMRTPMNAIIGMTQVALKNDTLNSEVRNSLEKIQGASDHLLGVINDVLDMSKIESGKFSLMESEVVVETLLRNVSVMADVQTEQKGQHFHVIVDEAIPPVLLVDGQRLTQVITNLLSNAFKFTPMGGEISLSIRLQAREKESIVLRFEVDDTGIGITEEQRARLFDPFEQANGSISRTFGGTGLGLTISRSIVEMMGGEIWVESEPGKGSRFIFTTCVKVAKNPMTALPGTEPQSEKITTFPGCRILLAEDIEINREVIIALMDGSGVTFDIAENGRIACEKYCADPERYHMIFMDIQMPEMDGLSATECIRASACPNASDIPIIAMTANAFREDVETYLAAGMNGHLAKPIEIEKVLETVQKYYGKGKNSLP